jgi:uridine kinase
MQANVMIIGIAGPSASGKSLLAHTIVDELGSDQVAIISEDSYYKDLKHLPVEERAKVNFDHPNSLEHELLSKHLRQLREGLSIDVPTYDFTKHSRKEATRRITKRQIIILEGILLFVDKTLREMMDIRIFMDTSLDVCLLRRIKRDLIERQRSIESILTQYHNTVRPMCLQFIEPSKRYADVIVPRGGANRIAIDMIKAKLRELLKINN